MSNLTLEGILNAYPVPEYPLEEMFPTRKIVEETLEGLLNTIDPAIKAPSKTNQRLRVLYVPYVGENYQTVDTRWVTERHRQ